MRICRCVGLTALSVIAATPVTLIATRTSAGAVRTRTTPPIGKQLAELKGSDTVAGDEFGSSVTISGSTAVVGAPFHARQAGRAYVFTKTAAGWKQVAELKGSDTFAADWFGSSVTISGSTAVVGAPFHARQAGRAYVFTKTASRLETGGRAEGLRHCRRRSSSAPRWPSRARPPSWVQCSTRRGAGRAYVFTKTAAGWKQVGRAEGLRHRRRRRLRLLGGHLGHDRRRRCAVPRKMPAGRTCSPRRRPAGSRSPS